MDGSSFSKAFDSLIKFAIIGVIAVWVAGAAGVAALFYVGYLVFNSPAFQRLLGY